MNNLEKYHLWETSNFLFSGTLGPKNQVFRPKIPENLNLEIAHQHFFLNQLQTLQ